MPALQLLIYPAVDWALQTRSAIENAEGYGLTTVEMQWAWSQYVPDARDRSNPLASPLRAPSLANLPPAIVITTEFDVLRDEGQQYADRLEDAGVPVSRHHYDGTIHGFLWMAAVVDEFRKMWDDVASDLCSIWGRRSDPP
jgi:acetyl esterase